MAQDGDQRGGTEKPHLASPKRLRKGAVGTAIAYTLGLWPRLRAYTADGRYLIDNNRIENTIRPLAIGRKNYLFAGSDRGACNAALLYSLLGTCKLHNLSQ